MDCNFCKEICLDNNKNKSKLQGQAPASMGPWYAKRSQRNRSFYKKSIALLYAGKHKVNLGRRAQLRNRSFPYYCESY